jgi:chromosome segregation ATPase
MKLNDREVRKMEQILHQILDKLQVVENSQLDMRKDIHDIKTEQAEMKAEQTEMRKELGGLKEEQAEMRKEVAFYYGTMMKKLDEVKTELSSEIKHISSVQKQHQHVLEIINEKQ